MRYHIAAALILHAELSKLVLSCTYNSIYTKEPSYVMVAVYKIPLSELHKIKFLPKSYHFRSSNKYIAMCT